MLLIKVQQRDDHWLVSTKPARLWPFWERTVCQTRGEAFDVAMAFAKRYEGPARPPRLTADDIGRAVTSSIDMTDWKETSVSFDSSFSVRVVVEFEKSRPQRFTVISGDSFATLEKIKIYEVMG